MAQASFQEKITFSQHVVYICSRFIAYDLPLLFFLVTTSFYLKTYDSAQVKITFTQIGTLMLTVFWLVRILVEGRWPFTKSDMVYVAPFLAFLASGIFAYLHTPFRLMAQDETVRRVIYMILALLTIAEMNSDERMKRLWRWLLAAAWFTTVYGFVQYLDTRVFKGSATGLDPFIWRAAFGPRVFSTFGNPNFYGNFLVIMTPLILATVLREKGSLVRPLVMLGITVGFFVVTDKMTLGIFGGADPSLQVVYSAMLIGLVILFFACSFWRVGASHVLPLLFVLCSLLYLNLYSTETKGAWIGFLMAASVTVWLIFEYFLHMDEVEVNPSKYRLFLAGLVAALSLALALMVRSFVMPLLRHEVEQVGFQILWIPTLFFVLISLGVVFWLVRKPWNLKKVIYGVILFFVLSMGGGMLQFAKARLLSVSFRLFTWISTWEMIRTAPIAGHGIGTFKVIYPAYRRPQIIVLEGKSNTETDHSEDEYIEVWQDEGTVGFGIFLWLILTAVMCGLKQVRWYSDQRAPDDGKKRKLLEIRGDVRSYEVLGILAAYIGALMHWFMDVSIRFVSSGVFSGLLPGALVAYARNHEYHRPDEVRMPYDRWIRAGVALSWTFIFVWLKLELVPQSFIQDGETTPGQILFFNVLAGAFLWLLIEVLEMGNVPQKPIPFSEQYPPISPSLAPVRAMCAGLVIAGGLALSTRFVDEFMADVHHNLAIFFSKEAIWMKSQTYDAHIAQLPPDLRDKYQRWGGALEHYAEVIKNNPAFPMAHYFTGNVYNDWGSQINGDSLNARSRGDLNEAQRLRDKSLEKWDLAEKAYEEVKRLAPNYVQTHHQVGLLFIKRAEQAAQWGETERSKQLYQTALHSFRLYKMLDPVFPPNYDRIAQIVLMDNHIQEAIDLYKEAVYYNDVVSMEIRKIPFCDRLPALEVSLAKLLFTQARSAAPDPFNPPLPQINEAIAMFHKAVDCDPNNLEAWKGLGFMLDKMGKKPEAQAAWQKAHALAPNDPELRVSPIQK